MSTENAETVTVTDEVREYWKNVQSDRSRIPRPLRKNDPYQTGDVIALHDNVCTIGIIDRITDTGISGFRLCSTTDFKPGTRFTWMYTHGKTVVENSGLLWRAGRGYLFFKETEREVPNPPLPFSVLKHDTSNPYVVAYPNPAEGRLCQNCGPDLRTSIFCTPVKNWRLNFETSLIPVQPQPLAHPKPLVRWTGYKAPRDLLGPAVASSLVCGMMRKP